MSTMNSHSDELAKALKQNMRGEVLLDAVSRGIYSTDASHYQITPSYVVIPLDEQDAIFALKTAGEFGIPITPRGGGTSLSGQTSSTGMIVDFSKYMNRVLEVNPQERWVRVQPGVIRDDLNHQLAQYGLHFAPDPATSSRAAIGGMVGNNSSGTRSILYGKTIDNVLECKVMLSDGTVITTAAISPEQWQAKEAQTDREGELYRGVRSIIERETDEIGARFPKVMRRVSGYNLDAFLPDGPDSPAPNWNLSNLIVGSEGTLATLLEAKLLVHPLPKATSLAVIHFDELSQSLLAVDAILEHQPAAVELLDRVVIREALTNPATAHMTDFVCGDPAAILIVELYGNSPEDAGHRVQMLVKSLQEQQIGVAHVIRCDKAEQQNVWDVRKLGLGLIANVKGSRKAQAFVEDACVPTNVLAEYIEKVKNICERHDVPVTFYAHASVGVIHTRPMLDLHLEEDVKKMKSIAYEAFELVKSYGGSWSGEHGDGLVRGEFIPHFFGPRIYGAFREIKTLFDPKGLMNPGKIVDALPMTENLRYGSDYRLGALPTEFHYRDHGSFVATVEQCAGVGACRKTSGGTMCPSYMATRDEEHSTRGRANALRLAMSGQLGPDAMASDRLHDTLKLCLACKACKTECPTSVDMSRLKSDVLQMRHAKHGVPWSAKLLGNAPKFSRRWAGPLAPIVNFIQSLPPVRMALQRVAGIDRRRPLPRLSSKPFAKPGQLSTTGDTLSSDSSTTVCLFVDTFTNSYEPHLAERATALLDSLGYRVLSTTVGCCQRPQISQGLLKEAIVDGTHTLRQLDHFAAAGIPILVLEPSCASSLVGDLPDLIGDTALGQRVSQQVTMLDEFLAEQLSHEKIRATWTSPFRKLLIHGHCHQKALFGTAAMKQLLDAVPGLAYEEIDSGCCGMAGSFGYQHFELSKTIGEDRLFPAVRSLDSETQVVACGISCRHQLHDMLGVSAKHWVEVVSATSTGPLPDHRRP